MRDFTFVKWLAVIPYSLVMNRNALNKKFTIDVDEYFSINDDPLIVITTYTFF